MNAHDRIEELIAAYALDALAETEEHDAGRDLLDHLASCERCQRLYREMRETAADMAFAVDAAAVSSDLRARVLGVAQEEPKPAAAPMRMSRVARGILAAALAGLLALGGVTATLWSRLDEANTEREQARQVLAFVNDPATSITTMEGEADGRVTLAVRPDGRAYLIGSGLRLPSGRIFEVWLVRGATVVPAATFDAEGGRALVAIRIDPQRDIGVAITIERERVEQPTGAPVFQGAISRSA